MGDPSIYTKLPAMVVIDNKSCIVNIELIRGQKLLRVVLGDPLCTGHVKLRMRGEISSLHTGINAIFAYNRA